MSVYASASGTRSLLKPLLFMLPLVGCDNVGEATEDFDRETPSGLPAITAGSLADTPSPAAQLPGFDLEITADSGDVVVAWANQTGSGGGATYTVWQGSDPYFQPGDQGSLVLASDLTQSAYIIVGADDDDNNYYYRVVATVDGVELLSTTAGKYVHSVITGYNKISLPLLTGITDASELAADMPEIFELGLLWDPSIQWWQIWGNPADGAPFAISDGQAPVVFAKWGTDTTYHQYGLVPDFDELQLSLQPGDNIVTVPLSFGDTTASDLFATVPGATQVGYWDNLEQSMVWYDGSSGPDFTVPAGSAIHLDVTTASTWPG